MRQDRERDGQVQYDSRNVVQIRDIVERRLRKATRLNDRLAMTVLRRQLAVIDNFIFDCENNGVRIGK